MVTGENKSGEIHLITKNSDKFGAKSYSEMWRGEKATQELPLLT